MDARHILDAIMDGRVSSRREIAELFGVRSATVSELVGGLIEAGLVVETTGRSRGRGRPASVLVAHTHALAVVVFQVVSQSIRASVVDLAGGIVLVETTVVPSDCDTDTMEAVLADLLAHCLRGVPQATRITAVSFSLSGVLDVRSRAWLFSSRWPRVRALSLGAIAEAAGLDCAVTRNLDAELRARLTRGEAADGTLILHWGYGIGAAYAIDGAAVNAEAGRFGEIGHWRLNRATGNVCRCGQRGCLETVASLWSMHPVLERIWPGIEVDEAAFADRARTLDLVDVPQVAEALDAIVVALGNLCRILFPRYVIISGPFIANPGIWARMNEQFRAGGVLVGVETPSLISGQRSEELEREGAARPLLERALNAMLKSRAVA